MKEKKGDYSIKEKLFKFKISPNALNAAPLQINLVKLTTHVELYTILFYLTIITIHTYTPILLYECFCTTVASIPKRPCSTTLQLYKFIVWRVYIKMQTCVILRLNTLSWPLRRGFSSEHAISRRFQIIYCNMYGYCGGLDDVCFDIYTFFRCVDYVFRRKPVRIFGRVNLTSKSSRNRTARRR